MSTLVLMHHSLYSFEQPRGRQVTSSRVMDNAEGGPGPSAARIKLTFPSSRTNGELAVGSSTNTHPLREDRDFSRLHDSSTNTVNLNDLSGDGITDGPAHIDARASTVVRGRGNRGRRGGRGKGAQRRDRDSRPGTRTNPARNAGRQSLSRTQEMMLDSDGKLNRKLTISFSKGSNTIRLGGEGARKSSFLGDYDRDLDENPSEPLVFEEQFVLRVPERMAGGLREMVKGKSKGLEGVEIKFLGTHSIITIERPVHKMLRLSASCVQVRGEDVFVKVGRPPQYHRKPEDL